MEQEPSFSMMQSWEWGEVKKQLGWDVFRVAVIEAGIIAAGAQILVKRLPLEIASLAYVPRGPAGNWRQPEIARLLFGQIHRVARQNHSVFLKVEPAGTAAPEIHTLFAELGFRKSTITNQPAATIIMDISSEDERILRGMRDSTRRKIPAAERKGVTVRRGGMADLSAFYRLMQVTARRTGFTLRDFHYYETEFQTFAQTGRAALFLAEYQGHTLAAHIVYTFGRHAAFFHQASDTEIANLNPNCLLVWEEIKWAKTKGCCTFDLWGIPDEIAQYIASGQEPDPNRTDGLWGVYRFKSGFSKNIVCYLGAMDYVYSPFLYRALTNKILNQKTFEQISSWMDTHLFRRVERDHG
jgi:lipid II:glycine glycyltransferase (peptidoglycan interpeptide bridge formation enzyme)